jgi:hypothetical protein
MRTGQCTLSAQTSPQHLIILGAPIVGQPQLNTLGSGPRVLSARHVLDTGREIEQVG